MDPNKLITQLRKTNIKDIFTEAVSAIKELDRFQSALIYSGFKYAYDIDQIENVKHCLINILEAYYNDTDKLIEDYLYFDTIKTLDELWTKLNESAVK